MKKVGNAASNRLYNPEGKKPPVPIDADEADSAMERFIRSKYVQTGTKNGTKNRSGSIESDEGTPPPLPPKTGGRFSFKPGSSTFPLHFRSKRESRSRDGPTSPQGISDNSKPSKVLGASVHNDSPEALAQKLTQLREMGFTDDKRNTMVLKGVNGNLERTIEALVRLGEGSGASTPFIPSRESSLPASRSLTPQPTAQTTIGLSRASPATSRSPSTPSNNPWDVSPAPPQSSQSTGTMQNKNPFYANPFGPPSQQAEFALNQSLQNLSLAPTQQQQLFPHHTGGLPGAQPISHQVYQQPMTSPVPQNNQFATNAIYGNGQAYAQPVQPAQQSYNPFLQSTPAAQSISVNTTAPQSQNPFGGNPFTRSPSNITSTSLNQIPEQSQQNFYHSPQSPPYGSNPFFGNGQLAQPPPMQQPAYYQPQQPQQLQQYGQAFPQQTYQQPQRPDKAAIMALYNVPSPTPVPPAQGQYQPTGTEVNQPAAAQPVAQPPTSPQRSVSVPMPGNKNPFMNNGSAGTSGARSRESMTLGMEMAWNNGRHSPDAFASLSARSG